MFQLLKAIPLLRLLGQALGHLQTWGWGGHYITHVHWLGMFIVIDDWFGVDAFMMTVHWLGVELDGDWPWVGVHV